MNCENMKCTSSFSGSVANHNLCISQCQLVNNSNNQNELLSSCETPKVHKCHHRNCNSTFYRISHLQDHLNRHDGIRPYKCLEKNCKKSFYAWAKLRAHLIACHELNVRKSMYMGGNSDKKNHKCPYETCSASFDRRWKLQSHMCKHTGEKLHQCPKDGCGRAYTSIGSLRRHVSTTHSQSAGFISEYVCTEEGCNKVYKSMGSVRRHYKIHHNRHQQDESPCKEPMYNCNKCHLDFTNIIPWKKHLKEHSIYKCNAPGCIKEFMDYSSLKKHKIMEHTDSTNLFD